MSGNWRDRRVPEFQEYLRRVLGREPTERDYAAAVMQLEQRGAGSVAVGHAFRNRLATEGGDPARHLRHYDPIALGHRWREITPQAINRWGAEYDRISEGFGPLKPGMTHFFSPAGMQAYYDKNPSLVRSAVRMNVPGHGEVLVPNWATKAVAAGDFVNVNGEWFLTPNERYRPSDTQVASTSQPDPRVAAPASSTLPPRSTETPPSATVAAPSPPPTVAATAPAVRAETPSVLSSLSNYGQTALKIAGLMGGAAKQQQAEEPDPPMQFVHQPIRPTNVEFNAAVPYMDRAEGAMRLARAEGGRTNKAGNEFAELTPEQKALIERDKINESLGPFDFMPGSLTALYGAGGAAIGSMLPGGLRSIPSMARTNRGWSSAPTLEAVKDAVVQTGAIGSGVASIGYIQELIKRVVDRERKEREMMFGDGSQTKRADGGSINDTGMNAPETMDSLRAQQRQLIEGRRPAQMFPRGTPELPLPPGLERIETERGVFHYDPIQITADEIIRASAMSRENEVLGLGPMSKDDVATIARERGEMPVAITERDPIGNEVRASMATPSTVEMQSDAILRSAAPGHSVDVEPVEDVIAQRDSERSANAALRLARADGGGIVPVGTWDDLPERAQHEIVRQYPDRVDRPDGTRTEDILTGNGRVMHSGEAMQFRWSHPRAMDPDPETWNTLNPKSLWYSKEADDYISKLPPLDEGPDHGQRLYARGGGIGGGGIAGPLYGATGGRADKVPATARSGSHVIPADIVSHMGQGNSMAGLKALERMFSTGPYGTKLPPRRGRRGFSDGGEIGSDEIPVMLSDGEFVVPPEVVAELGRGDVALGHDVLDSWIMDERQKAIDTLASLPPPATD